MILFENNYASIESVTSTIIMIKWTATYIPIDNYRGIYNKSLEMAVGLKMDKWVSDITRIKVHSADNLQWLLEEWVPEAVDAGCLKKQAIVVSDTFFNEISVKIVNKNVNGQEIEIQYFKDTEDAFKWLH